MNHKIRLTVEKIERRLELLQKQVYRQRTPLPPFRYHPLPDARIPDDLLTIADTDWHIIAPGTYWGPIQTSFIMRGTFIAPPEYAGHAALHLPMGRTEDFAHPEALIYVDGVALLTVDRFHEEILLPDALCDGAEHTLTLHGWTGFWNAQGLNAQLLMRECAVVWIDQPTRDLWLIANAALRMTTRYTSDSPLYHDLLTALDDAFHGIDLREPLGDAFYDSVRVAQVLLSERLASIGQPLNVDVLAVGHAHIDVAWLWVLEQTRRKAMRTFYSQLNLMQHYPQHIFTQSQPQLYDYVRQDDPALFAQIQAAVKRGQWELIGGMWIEADCNLSGAESLARQFLYGRLFFREHFGADQDSPVLWLPDVFGYSAQLPQLIKLAGMEYFFTIKIGWSQYNKLPYDSFWWQGLDGTRVMTHFSTTPENEASEFSSTYNAPMLPESPMQTWQKFKQKEIQRTLLTVYGWGDGGGGPTRDMIDNIHTMRAFPGSPRTQHSTAIEFFRRMERESGARLPTWNGELYLEYHRGTYTTQSRNKRANRKSEIALHNAEFLAAYARSLMPDYAYPTADFRRAWELVCLNQFHDIIPGSSIHAVYEDSQAQYTTIFAMAEKAQTDALAALQRYTASPALTINPTPFEIVLADGRYSLPYAIGTVVPLFGDADFAEAPIITPTLLENAVMHVELDAAGDIIRIYDRENEREVLPAGAVANQLQAFEDRPNNWDAWDLDITLTEKMWLADPASSIEVIAHNHTHALKITRRILNSAFTQIISLDARQVRVDMHIDWQETHIMLKVAFPVDILSPIARFDIQWGYVERPTHWNTSWDWARFETVGHKWADLSESNYGVSLLNDCKYGYDVKGNVLRLSLLRSPTFPDETADKGAHTFSYALLPHTDHVLEETMRAAYALNNPIIQPDASGRSAVLPSLIAVENWNVLIETIKWAEDGSGLIVRLYEPYRARGAVTLTTAFDFTSVERVNLIEDTLDNLETSEPRTVRLTIKPFEIVTLKFQLKTPPER